MKDIFDVQDEITLSVVDALKLKLLGDEKEEVLKRYTHNAEAYQLYLRGRFFFFKRTPEGFKKAIEYFGQAIELDADYALAYSGLADCYTFLGFYELMAPAGAKNNLKSRWRSIRRRSNWIPVLRERIALLLRSIGSRATMQTPSKSGRNFLT